MSGPINISKFDFISSKKIQQVFSPTCFLS